MTTTLPRHIAIVMDGNGRWAKARHLPRKMGHHAGGKAVRALVEQCARRGIEVLTLFAFSSENWQRPAEEVAGLMQLFFESLEKELPSLIEQQIRLRIIGDRSLLSAELQQRIREAETKTASYSKMNLVLAVSYGGRWDIIQATKALASAVASGELTLAEVTEAKLAQHLSLSDLPDPDLFIRTSGEQRISNFLIWQMAYSELYFTEKNWPDFNEKELERALEYYAQRERRFGLTAEQIKEERT